jgi:hypothetical protein
VSEIARRRPSTPPCPRRTAPAPTENARRRASWRCGKTAARWRRTRAEKTTVRRRAQASDQAAPRAQARAAARHTSLAGRRAWRPDTQHARRHTASSPGRGGSQSAPARALPPPPPPRPPHPPSPSHALNTAEIRPSSRPTHTQTILLGAGSGPCVLGTSLAHPRTNSPSHD